MTASTMAPAPRVETQTHTPLPTERGAPGNVPHGTARSYQDLQAVLRAVAELRRLSREQIDELAGLPRGYASKVLAELPSRSLGPDTLGPMVGALGVQLLVVDDPDALARYTERADKRVEFRAQNAVMHSGTVHVKLSRRKLRKMQRKGGKNSRKRMSWKTRRGLARKAARARWSTPKLIEITNQEATNGKSE